MNLLKQLFGTDVPAISAAQARNMIDTKQTHLVLDVRQPHEYQSGHISGAKLIPLNELANRMRQLPKDRPIIAVCRSGSRSVHATRMLTEAGYQVENLRGGMIAWQAAGFPTKKGNGK
jgi:rhodanese-related sulfurtransferase